MSATATINAPADRVFAVLCDPTQHAAIDGTGWVCDSVDGRSITGSGQVFRMAMYHPDHPDGSYEIHNRVLAFEPPRAVSWKPGYVSDETGELEFGGWVWRYDVAPGAAGSSEVTLTYDWSAVGAGPREHLPFPPFAPDHLQNSLNHLATLVER